MAHVLDSAGTPYPPSQHVDRGRGRAAKATHSPLGFPDIEDAHRTTTHFSFTEQQATRIRTHLLCWYDAHQRQLPWRHRRHAPVGEASCPCPPSKPLHADHDAEPCCGPAADDAAPHTLCQQRAYATWVSEVMLQQTRVATVIDYYNRWMEKWPTVNHLAAATEEEVNAVWAGLGYYRRACFLLEGAREIVNAKEGLLPSSAQELQMIRGIGKYTAGAIASIAFDQPVPVVDGNVIRVICRLKAISSSPKASSTLKTIWSLAGQLVDVKRPGDLNQALMELGATRCTSSSPDCDACPLKDDCEAYTLSKVANKSRHHVSVTDFPMKVLKNSPRQDFVAVCVLEKIEHSSNKVPDIGGIMPTGSFLLVKRPKKGLLAGLWEFPSANLDGPKASLKVRKATMDKYLEGFLGLDIGKGGHLIRARESVGTYVHIFSHIRLHMSIEWIQIFARNADELSKLNLEVEGTKFRWVDASTIQDIGLTSGVRKVYELFLDFRSGAKSEGAAALHASKTKRKRA